MGSTIFRIRPSTAILLTALPFIVYLFATSADYQRSLRAIVGVDIGSAAQVPGFIMLSAMFAAGLLACWPALYARRLRSWHLSLAGLSVALAATAWTGDLVLPYVHAVVANAVDPFTSKLIVPQVTPRRLTDATAVMVSALARRGLLSHLVLSALAFTVLVWKGPGRKVAAWLLLASNGAGLAAIVLFAYVGFAAGIATTIRAALFAYGLGAFLGLVWVLLLQLRTSRIALVASAALTAGCVALSGYFLLQPPDDYVLAGSLSGKVAIIKGTPSRLIDDIRFGRFDGAPGGDAEIPVKSFADENSALEAVSGGEDVSAAILRAEIAQDGAMPVLWRASLLNDRDRNYGIVFLVLAIATGLLTGAGFSYGRHPLALGSEFIIDSIRGIPMLVIVLYVGLPLSGALKDASQGVLDPPNFLRGVVAMAIAYSAYLAEIMRGGIKAIPSGQFEASSSLGLTRLQTARLVITPQVFRIILPALGNELIAILKDTSLLSVLSIRDITQRTREFQSASFLPFAPYNSATIVYIILTLSVASLLSGIERKNELKQR